MPLNDPCPSTVEERYMSWYRSITRRFISPHIRPPVGQYQPLSQDLYVVGQHVPTQGIDVLNQLSVDQSFFYSQQDMGRGSCTTDPPMTMSPPYIPLASTPPMSYPTSFPMASPTPSPYFPSFEDFASSSRQQPSLFSDLGEYAWTSSSPYSYRTSSMHAPSPFMSTSASSVFISPTRPIFRDERNICGFGYDPTLAPVQETSREEDDGETENEDED